MANLHKIFINYPVQDLLRSMGFFKALGYTFNMRFSDDNTACLVLGDDIFVMLLIKPFFRGLITNMVAEAIISLSVDNLDAVDALVNKALAVGGSPSKEPNDMGFMHGWSFLDPDCHHWGSVQYGPKSRAVILNMK